MGIDKLRRMMLRIRARHPDAKSIKEDDLKRVVIIEAGASPYCYKYNKNALIKLGWLKKRKRRFVLTGNDLTEDY